MTFQAPALRPLVEERLRRARLELMEDSRIDGAARGRSDESPGFVLQIVEEKLAAAARGGYEAAAASLRVEASDWLRQHGQPMQSVRDALRQAEGALKVPGRPASMNLPGWLPQPMIAASVTFFLLSAVVLIAWGVLNITPLAVAGLVAIAGVPALAAKAGVEHVATALKKHVAREYPARLCRLYLDAFDRAVNTYASQVAELTAEKD